MCTHVVRELFLMCQIAFNVVGLVAVMLSANINTSLIHHLTPHLKHVSPRQALGKLQNNSTHNSNNSRHYPQRPSRPAIPATAPSEGSQGPLIKDVNSRSNPAEVAELQ